MSFGSKTVAPKTGAAFLAALAITGSLAACGGDATPGKTVTVRVTPTPTLTSRTALLGVGDTVSYGQAIDMPADAAVLATPVGSLSFVTGASSSYLTTPTRNYAGMNGAVVLPVQWTFTPPAASSSAVGLSGMPSAATVRLVVDGKTYSLGTSTGTSAAVALGLPSGFKKVTATVTYGGLTQTVSLPGQKSTGTGYAASLTDGLSMTGTATCPAISNNYRSGAVGVQVLASCGIVAVNRYAYLPGSGWAGPGKTWVVVTMIVNPGSFSWHNPNGSVTNYTVTHSVKAASLAGAGATVAKQNNQYTLTFAAPAGQASMPLAVSVPLSGTAIGPTSQPVAPAASTTPVPTSTSAQPPSSGTTSGTASPSSTAPSTTTPAPTSSSSASSSTLPSLNAPGTLTVTIVVNSTIQFSV